MDRQTPISSEPDATFSIDTQEQVRRRAFEIYEQRGREDGHELDELAASGGRGSFAAVEDDGRNCIANLQAAKRVTRTYFSQTTRMLRGVG